MSSDLAMPLDDLAVSSPEERQRYTRRSTLVAAHIRISDELLEVDILDLSEGGAKLSVPVVLDLGQRVVLLVEGVGEFPARVVWQSGQSHGIEFRDDPDVIAEEIPQIIESAQDARERRQHVRHSVLWKAELFSGIRRSDCEILNISEGGARVRLAKEFPLSDLVTIRSIHFGERKGKVVWQDGDRLGMQFIEPEPY